MRLAYVLIWRGVQAGLAVSWVLARPPAVPRKAGKTTVGQHEMNPTLFRLHCFFNRFTAAFDGSHRSFAYVQIVWRH